MISWNDIEFAHKAFFWLLLFIPVHLAWYWWKYRERNPKITLSTLSYFSDKKTPLELWRHSLLALRLIGFTALVFVLARPQSSSSWQNVTTEGIDIIIALDISGSMLAQDFKPNRLEASKDVAMDFIEERINDRIGLVIYSGESFTQCPLTTDHAVLKNLFNSIKNGMIEDGTAIGMGLANAVTRLKDSEAKSKVVILLTDGFNTAGSIPPLTAAEIAKSFGVRVYTIGVGTSGMAPYPFKDAFGRTVTQLTEVKIDEKTLKEIAKITGGNYFRATDNKKLAEIYAEIDQLEKSKIEVTEFRKKHEAFFPFALLAGIVLLAEFLLKNTLFRSIT